MEVNMLVTFLLVSAVGITFANPIQLAQPNYDNIPRCLQPVVSGLCLAYFPSYAYNAATETCDQFIYGGCQGNLNRFVTFTECMSACAGFKSETKEFKLRTESDESQESSEDSQTSKSAEESQTSKSVEESDASESTDESADPCSLPSEMGPCRAMKPRFYFNGNGNGCETFIYGGCQGNGNNFRSVEDCERTCGGPRASEAHEESSENKTEDESLENKTNVVSEEKSDKPADA